MGSEVNRDELTRRDFLKRAAAGAAAAVGAASSIGLGLPALSAAENQKNRSMKRRTLGRTNLKVSELGMGTIRVENPAVVHRAMDLGVNFFDTAECYQEGNSEIKLGKALRGRRDKAVVATKWHTDGTTPAADLLASLDGSLKRLAVDYVDLVQIHGAESEKEVNSDELWKAFTKARQAGKVRFNGVTTHGNQVTVIRAAVASGRFDTVLPSHNVLTADSVGPALAEAKKANVGVIIMKALAPVHEAKGTEAFKHLSGNPYQRAIQWVLQDHNVATVIVDMPSFEELEIDVAAATGTVSQAALQAFEAATATIAAGACHLCGACTGQCPAGVKVADIMRYLLYRDGYGDAERAAALYQALPASSSATACTKCAGCKAICPWGVPIRSRMERAHAVLA